MEVFLIVLAVVSGLLALAFMAPSSMNGRTDETAEANDPSVNEYVAKRWRSQDKVEWADQLEGNPSIAILRSAREEVECAFANAFATQSPDAKAKMLERYRQKLGGELRAKVQALRDLETDNSYS